MQAVIVGYVYGDSTCGQRYSIYLISNEKIFRAVY
jgi:hypothetical protein